MVRSSQDFLLPTKAYLITLSAIRLLERRFVRIAGKQLFQNTILLGKRTTTKTAITSMSRKHVAFAASQYMTVIIKMTGAISHTHNIMEINLISVSRVEELYLEVILL